VNLYYDRFIILANIVNVLLFGTLTRSIDVMLLLLSIVIPLGVRTEGLINLIDVGVPSSYLVKESPVAIPFVIVPSGTNTLIVVPLASTSAMSLQLRKSISSVKLIQFCTENFVNLVVLVKLILVILSILEVNVEPSSTIPVIFGKDSKILFPL